MQVTDERIKALMDAIEGECEGLAISPEQAKVILDYVDAATLAHGEPVAWHFIYDDPKNGRFEFFDTEPNPPQKWTSRRPLYTHPTPQPSGAVQECREEAAAIIYEAMAWAAHCGPGPGGTVPKWIDGGNSLGQDEARRAADRILSALTPAAKEPSGPVQVKPLEWQKCATEDCGKVATVHFERGGVGSYYCHHCYMRIQALPAAPTAGGGDAKD